MHRAAQACSEIPIAKSLAMNTKAAFANPIGSGMHPPGKKREEKYKRCKNRDKWQIAERLLPYLFTFISPAILPWYSDTAGLCNNE
jgi:hypothetical protein